MKSSNLDCRFEIMEHIPLKLLPKIIQGFNYLLYLPVNDSLGICWNIQDRVQEDFYLWPFWAVRGYSAPVFPFRGLEVSVRDSWKPGGFRRRYCSYMAKEFYKIYTIRLMEERTKAEAAYV